LYLKPAFLKILLLNICCRHIPQFPSFEPFCFAVRSFSSALHIENDEPQHIIIEVIEFSQWFFALVMLPWWTKGHCAAFIKVILWQIGPFIRKHVPTNEHPTI
jgi:hypothetical protein